MAFKYVIIFLVYNTLQINMLPFNDIDMGMRNGAVIKTMRDASNQTQEDTLNLPANASSIRENITDTFSCDNRTYGYYADIDNECQVFHVCLPSQTPSGRNTTYRWSFICPSETIFNQEVLTCTRPRDSINCENSEMYYDVNMEMGKLPNDTQSSEPTNNAAGDQNSNAQNQMKKDVEKIRVNKQKPERRRQNLIAQKLFEEMKHDMKGIEDMQADMKEMATVVDNQDEMHAPELISVTVEEPNEMELNFEDIDSSNEMESAGKKSERSMSRGQRRRSGFRFKADA